MTTLTETKKAVRTFWGNRPCGVDDSDQPLNSPEFFAETEVERFRIHLNWDRPFLEDAIGYSKHTGKTMLEIGCGVGVDSVLWHRAGNKVFSLDYNLPSVQITQARFANEGVKSPCLNGDAESLPFTDGTFDLIYSFGVLHHTPDTQKTIDEVYRCLKPGGQAIIMLYHKWSALILGETVLGYGIRRGKLFKTRSIARLISEFTEFQSQYEGNVNPLTKVYSKREIRKMFKRFDKVDMELHYLWPGHFGPLRRLLAVVPDGVKRNLHRVFGWNVVIKATRSA